MKKLIASVCCALLCAAAAFAQFRPGEGELILSGEVKTGLYWKQVQEEGKEPEDPYVRLHSMDDAGGDGDQGRFRLNMDYENPNGLGFKVRIQWQNWIEEFPRWPYAFGYGNFFDNQLTIAIGKLGASPWGTGGPEMWAELETTRGGGMRVEWKPAFVPGNLNVGFVLNYFDGEMESANRTTTFADLLMETLFGASYVHDKFLARLAVRLDSDKDWIDRGSEMPGEREGIAMLYRLEERTLGEFLPGMQVWALGVLKGVGATQDVFYNFVNWLFAEYSPPQMGNLTDPFTAQLRFGYDHVESRSIMHVKPSFYWHFFDKLISVGASFWYGQDFGRGKLYEGSPYAFIELEPKIQLNFAGQAYIAFIYNFRREYEAYYPEARGADPIKQIQRMNLRFCIYY